MAEHEVKGFVPSEVGFSEGLENAGEILESVDRTMHGQYRERHCA